MSAWTRTPLVMAFARAVSISLRSKRKMTISTLFFAWAIALTSGITPSPGWTNSLTGISPELPLIRRSRTFLMQSGNLLAVNQSGYVFARSRDPEGRMRKNIQVLTLFLAAALLGFPAGSVTKAIVSKHAEKAKTAGEGPAVLWRQPSDIATRDLFYGPGGEKHQPHGPYTFESEDLGGTNPKFVVRDSDGVKWKVKLGEEARPETAASRIVWGVGYMDNEDYFLPKIQVKNLPPLPPDPTLIGPTR